MTNLEQFLKKGLSKSDETMDPASGSFTCQNNDCREVVYDGYIDRSHGNLKWICSNGHESSVKI